VFSWRQVVVRLAGRPLAGAGMGWHMAVWQSTAVLYDNLSHLTMVCEYGIILAL
jgi:hypothetical protein